MPELQCKHSFAALARTTTWTGLGKNLRDLRVWLYGKCALFQGRVMENLRDFKTSFPSHVWWLWRPGVRLLCVSDHVLHTSLGYMNRFPAQVACSQHVTRNRGLQSADEGDPESSPGHEERPVDLFRQTSLSAVHGNQNTCKTPCGRTNVASKGH